MHLLHRSFVAPLLFIIALLSSSCQNVTGIDKKAVETDLNRQCLDSTGKVDNQASIEYIEYAGCTMECCSSKTDGQDPSEFHDCVTLDCN